MSEIPYDVIAEIAGKAIREVTKDKRLRIKSCSNPGFWYKNFIGYDFEVTELMCSVFTVKPSPKALSECPQEKDFFVPLYDAVLVDI